MKAKRIISLLLTVAMIAACGVTAFAGPTGYVTLDEDNFTVVNEKGVAAGDQEILNGAVKADPDAIKADLIVTPIDDAAANAYAAANPAWGVAADIRSEWMIPETMNAYEVKLNVSEMGTLVVKALRAAQYGLKLENITSWFTYDTAKMIPVGMVNKFDTSVTFYDDYAGTLKIQYPTAGTFAAKYPTTVGTYEDAAVDFATILVYAEKDATLTPTSFFVFFQQAELIANATNVNGFLSLKYPVWVKASTVMEAEGGNDEAPTVGAITSGEMGVAIKDAEGKKYDNAYAVSATITGTAADQLGVLFIPATLLTGDLTINTPDVAVAVYEGAALNNGTITINAALKNIPRGVSGHANLKFTTAAYAKVGDNYTYGAPFTSDVLVIGDTGEINE